LEEDRSASISQEVLNAFSRAILSSDIFQGQDLACVLIVLYAAVEQFGTPRYLVTDNGAVFRAKQLLAICEELEIEKGIYPSPSELGKPGRDPF